MTRPETLQQKPEPLSEAPEPVPAEEAPVAAAKSNKAIWITVIVILILAALAAVYFLNR